MCQYYSSHADSELNKKGNLALGFLTFSSRGCCHSPGWRNGSEDGKKKEGFIFSPSTTPHINSHTPTIKTVPLALLSDLSLTQLSSDSISHFQKMMIMRKARERDWKWKSIYKSRYESNAGKKHLGRMNDGRLPASMCSLKEEMGDVLGEGWINLVHSEKLGVRFYQLKLPINFLFLTLMVGWILGPLPQL